MEMRLFRTGFKLRTTGSIKFGHILGCPLAMALPRKWAKKEEKAIRKVLVNSTVS